MLTPEELTRIDKALTAVIESPGDFDSFQVDFAFNNADRVDRYGVKTAWSVKQWGVIARIEHRIKELGEAA